MVKESGAAGQADEFKGMKTADEVIELYKLGRRDFRFVAVVTSNFNGADLTGADFSHSTIFLCNFNNCNLSSCKFEHSDLSDCTFVNAEFYNADLTSTNMYGSNLMGAKLGSAIFVKTILAGCKIEKEQLDEAAEVEDIVWEVDKKQRTKMSASDIYAEYKNGRKDFSNIDAQAQDFSGMILKGIIFKGSNLHAADFANVDLTDADFSECDITTCSFKSATLKRTNFFRSNFFWSTLNGAYLEKTNMRNSNLTWCDLRGLDLGQADTIGADISGSRVDETAPMMAIQSESVRESGILGDYRVKGGEESFGAIGSTYISQGVLSQHTTLGLGESGGTTYKSGGSGEKAYRKR
ncbi:MAG: pentapeptide repeat-containing protein [Candidatus Aenigmarchaeota archaeon]|nr:pentapeptide repeat-containing protein [Candidatus Aenigmarchaeota archaeon]